MEEEVVDEGKEETEERATKEGGSGRAGRSEKSGNGTEEAGAEGGPIRGQRMTHAHNTGAELQPHQPRPRLDQDERQDTSEVRVGRRSEGPAPSVEKLERARLDRTARAEDEGPEGSGHSTTVLERLAVSRGREDVRHRPARPVDERQRGVRVGASRKRAGVLRGERDHSDVDLLHSVGTGDAKVRPELGAGDERLENNTKLGVR